MTAIAVTYVSSIKESLFLIDFHSLYDSHPPFARLAKRLYNIELNSYCGGSSGAQFITIGVPLYKQGGKNMTDGNSGNYIWRGGKKIELEKTQDTFTTILSKESDVDKLNEKAKSVKMLHGNIAELKVDPEKRDRLMD